MLTKSNFQDVEHFHRYFGIDYKGPPRQLPDELIWRVGEKDLEGFIAEELVEYREARASGDLAKQFDALIDMVYVILGTAQLQGFPWQKGWFEVHYANMQKRRAVDGEGRGTGDIRKPEGWTPPNIEGILKSWEILRTQRQPVGSGDTGEISNEYGSTVAAPESSGL